MARIPDSGPRGPFQRLVFFFARRALGQVPNSLRLWARHPRLFRAVVGMERAWEGCRELPARLRTIVEVRVATLVGCPY